MNTINPNQPTHTMNNDNIIEEKVQSIEKTIFAIMKSADERKDNVYGHLGALLIGEIETALLEVHTSAEREGWRIGVLDAKKALRGSRDNCMCYEKNVMQMDNLLVGKLLSSLTPTDNNKEDGKPLETALAEATSN